jgi:sugar phosphate isomerase/epimerase
MHFILSIARSILSSSAAILWVTVLSLTLSFGFNIQPSSAEVSTQKQALQEIKRDQAAESPVQAYEEMTKIVEDPKVGIEKEYEKKEQEYFENHPESAGLVEKTKELVNSVTESK